jgi:hypothetical protein
VKLISCLMTVVVDLIPNSTLVEGLCISDKYAFFVCFRDSVFGEKIEAAEGMDLLR